MKKVFRKVQKGTIQVFTCKKSLMTKKKLPVRFTGRGCVKMMHPLFRYRTIGFSFFIEYDLFFPVSMLSGGTICRRWLTPPLYFDNFCLSSSHS